MCYMYNYGLYTCMQSLLSGVVLEQCQSLFVLVLPLILSSSVHITALCYARVLNSLVSELIQYAVA